MNPTSQRMNNRSRLSVQQTAMSELRIKVGNEEIDLSNLCLVDDDSRLAVPNCRGRTVARRSTINLMQKREYQSLYPKDVVMPEIASAAEAFSSAPRRKSNEFFAMQQLRKHQQEKQEQEYQQRAKRNDDYSSDRNYSGNRNNDRPSDSNRAPGAYRSMTALVRPKPPLPTWVERDIDSMDEEFEDKKTTDTSGECNGATQDGHYQEDPVPRSQIEVAPGYFMDLRGSQETMEYIQHGLSTVVDCVCCEVGLRCVGDAEMVICPDCRVISPVPQDAALISRCVRSRPGVSGGGVGLGLKIDVES